ncbi:FG-GAP repeat domain-containing protein [Kitasatospora sp. NPDC127059]|uniref:FG-GAP repeat domain-containing protein n=1 Tax=unclassified Kitasatospora TaxID=2633591 RepID=UPI0036466114
MAGGAREGLLGYARAPFYSGGTGKADLVSADADGDLRQFGNIDGLAFKWAPAQVVKSLQADPSRVFFADLTGSGRKDLVVDNPDGTLTAWPNTGSGYGSSRQVGSGWNGPARIRFADLNGDGRAEVISIDANGNLRASRTIDGISGNRADGVTVDTGRNDPTRTVLA